MMRLANVGVLMRRHARLPALVLVVLPLAARAIVVAHQHAAASRLHRADDFASLPSAVTALTWIVLLQCVVAMAITLAVDAADDGDGLTERLPVARLEATLASIIVQALAAGLVIAAAWGVEPRAKWDHEIDAGAQLVAVAGLGLTFQALAMIFGRMLGDPGVAIVVSTGLSGALVVAARTLFEFADTQPVISDIACPMMIAGLVSHGVVLVASTRRPQRLQRRFGALTTGIACAGVVVVMTLGIGALLARGWHELDADPGRLVMGRMQAVLDAEGSAAGLLAEVRTAPGPWHVVLVDLEGGWTDLGPRTRLAAMPPPRTLHGRELSPKRQPFILRSSLGLSPVDRDVLQLEGLAPPRLRRVGTLTARFVEGEEIRQSELQPSRSAAGFIYTEKETSTTDAALVVGDAALNVVRRISLPSPLSMNPVVGSGDFVLATVERTRDAAPRLLLVDIKTGQTRELARDGRIVGVSADLTSIARVRGREKDGRWRESVWIVDGLTGAARCVLTEDDVPGTPASGSSSLAGSRPPYAREDLDERDLVETEEPGIGSRFRSAPSIVFDDDLSHAAWLRATITQGRGTFELVLIDAATGAQSIVLPKERLPEYDIARQSKDDVSLVLGGFLSGSESVLLLRDDTWLRVDPDGTAHPIGPSMRRPVPPWGASAPAHYLGLAPLSSGRGVTLLEAGHARMLSPHREGVTWLDDHRIAVARDGRIILADLSTGRLHREVFPRAPQEP